MSARTPRILRRWAAFAAALALALLAVSQLERARDGIARTALEVGTTPATLLERPGAEGPLVVIAHGFAGSRQLMEAYALTLARAGYRALAFDFEGHGRNPVPMSGDVTSVDGTTERLIAETLRVVEAGREATGWQGEVALLGHSMATDIIVRAALRDAGVGPVVAISMFSEAVTPTEPPNLLMITGQLEGALRGFAREAVAEVDPSAGEGDTARSGEVVRRAVVAPWVEHVGVLYSATGLTEAVRWLDAAYGRESTPAPAAMGGWIALLLIAIVAMARPLSQVLPQRAQAAATPLAPRVFWAAALVPALAAPLIAVWIEIGALPVLVADYLAVHLAIYGAVQLGILAWAGAAPGRFSPAGAIALAAWAILVFGLALDRYGANFTPTPDRLLIIGALAIGTLPFMVGDALVTGGGRAPLVRRLAARVAFFLSLGLATALDLERLFFLLIIAPVIVLFFLVFGLMGRWVARRSGALAAGVGLGVALAWALGVSFPLFEATG